MKIEDNIMEKLVEIRKEMGLRQVDIADSLNVTQPVISELESGKTSPRIKTIIKYADALGYKMKLVKKNDAEDDD